MGVEIALLNELENDWGRSTTRNRSRLRPGIAARTSPYMGWLYNSGLVVMGTAREVVDWDVEYRLRKAEDE